MKKSLSLILALCMVFSLLSGCGGGTDTPGGSADPQGSPELSPEKQLSTFAYTTTPNKDVTTINIFNTASSGTFKTTVNFYDCLLRVDPYGDIVPGLAETWEISDDGLTYTFHIRDGACWADHKGEKKADVVAEDWLWGMEWVLNFWKNGSYNSAEPISVLAGAGDYYEYTKSLSEEEGRALDLTTFLDMVGIEAPNDHTLVYHLQTHCAYFLSLCTGLAFYPVSGELLDEIGPAGFLSMSYDDSWYSGPYLMTGWVEKHEVNMVKNPLYWDEECIRFDAVTLYTVESEDIAYQMFQNGEIQEVQRISNSLVNMIKSDPGSKYYDNIVLGPPTGVPWFLYFNYAKKNSDGTPDVNWNKAVANEAFRKCFYYGVDLTNYLYVTNPLDAMGLANSTITAPNISRFSDGSDYVDHVLAKTGVERYPEEYPHMDADKLAAYKEQAMTELAAQGVTFPIKIELWTSTSQTNVDTFTIVKECIEDSLGTDLVTVNINTFISNRMDEVIYPSLQSMAVDGYGATFMDPMTYLSQLVSDTDGIEAEFSGMWGNVSLCESAEVTDLFAEFTKMVRDADAILDPDARLEALSAAEAFAIEHCLIIPAALNRSNFLTCINRYTVPVMTSDFQTGRLINMETNADIYTFDEYEAAYEKFIAH